MTNIEVAIKHFEKRNEDFKGKLSADEVLKVLYFLKQCEQEKKKLIGIGYTTYEGNEPYEKIPLNQMYEGGFAVAAFEKDINVSSFRDKMFELANELAVAGYGNEAVRIHQMRNEM